MSITGGNYIMQFRIIILHNDIISYNYVNVMQLH